MCGYAESESKKGWRRRGGAKRLGNKGDGNKRRHSKIQSELESVTRKLIWRALSLVVLREIRGVPPLRAKHKDVNKPRQMIIIQGRRLQARICNWVENWWQQTLAQTLLAIHRL
jgi:hypothetical protein